MFPKLFPTEDDVQRWVDWATSIGCEVCDAGTWFQVNCPTSEVREKFLDGSVGNWMPTMAWGQYTIAYHEVLGFECCSSE
jgi:hypothetical protein